MNADLKGFLTRLEEEVGGRLSHLPPAPSAEVREPEKGAAEELTERMQKIQRSIAEDEHKERKAPALDEHLLLEERVRSLREEIGDVRHEQAEQEALLAKATESIGELQGTTKELEQRLSEIAEDSEEKKQVQEELESAKSELDSQVAEQRRATAAKNKAAQREMAFNAALSQALGDLDVLKSLSAEERKKRNREFLQQLLSNEDEGAAKADSPGRTLNEVAEEEEEEEDVVEDDAVEGSPAEK